MGLLDFFIPKIPTNPWETLIKQAEDKIEQLNKELDEANDVQDRSFFDKMLGLNKSERVKELEKEIEHWEREKKIYELHFEEYKNK